MISIPRKRSTGYRRQKRIRELEMENSFLKKAAAFFVKEQE